MKTKSEIKATVIDYGVDIFTHSAGYEDWVNDHIDSSNPLTESEKSDIIQFLRDCENDWNGVKCDPEGPTARQSGEMDQVLERYAEYITERIYNYSHSWVDLLNGLDSCMADYGAGNIEIAEGFPNSIDEMTEDQARDVFYENGGSVSDIIEYLESDE